MTGLSSADWAAWVGAIGSWAQAIGTVVAILAAYWMGSSQNRAQALREAAADRRVKSLCMHFGQSLADCLEQFVQGCATQNLKSLEQQHITLQEINSLVDEFRLERLPENLVPIVLSLRQVMSEAVAEDHSIWSGLAGLNWSQQHSRFVALKNRGHRLNTELQSAFA